MSFGKHAFVKDTRDKYFAAFPAIEYDVLAMFKTMQSRPDFIAGASQGGVIG
jgi:hypothetical protein